MNRYALCVVVLLSLILVGCTEDGEPPSAEATVPSRPLNSQQGESAGDAQQFNERLLEIARTYESYGRIDTTLRWGVVYCAPPGGWTASPRFSSSNDAATHGQKLYSLFVKDRKRNPFGSNSYIRAGKPNRVGQVLVKEAWVPEVVKNDDPQQAVTRKVKVRQGEEVVEEDDWFLPYAGKDGRLYRASRKSTLFIMLKLDPKTPGTDAGWVYGTVTADGKQVTSAGRVASCMKCHQKAPHDRLFGLPKE